MVSHFRFNHIGFRIWVNMIIRYHQVDEVEALVKDLMAASQKTREALELVSFLSLWGGMVNENMFQNVKSSIRILSSGDY